MSLSSEQLIRLIDAGLTTDQLRVVAEVMASKPERSSSAERMARKRARDNASQIVTCDVTVTEECDESQNTPLVPPSLSPVPPNSPPYNPPKTTTRRAACASAADFEPCWKTYPHVKSRMAKSKSLTEFRKLPPAEQNQLLAAITAYDASLRDRDREFVPAMERWIRDGKFRAFLPTDSPKTDRASLVSIYRDTGAWHPEWGEKPSREELAA